MWPLGTYGARNGPHVFAMRFIDIESMRTPFGYGGATRGLENPKPKPNKGKGLMHARLHTGVTPLRNPFAVSKNPFAFPGSSSAAVIGAPTLSFSIPSVSAADLAVQLACFRVPLMALSAPLTLLVVTLTTIVPEIAPNPNWC